ncbi:EamA family transporter [Legionella geestiana]|uniref:DMT family transporter n=1 Tax=Legionella geestiana TaxID=45065 RepID=UPI0010919717|nr:DMT family transporter [Legionella geestiana]QDQ39221.1 EamA family transporter [Legionella geestiana]
MVSVRVFSPTIAALSAALFFGGSTPFAKQLLGSMSPVLLAGLLYAGSGIGLILIRLMKDYGWHHSGLIKNDWFWLIGAISFGGILGPLLFMLGLQQMSAATTSLLLNLEAVLTALLAWFIFKESTAPRIVVGMVLIVAGGILLSWPQSGTSEQNIFGSIFIAGACLCWAMDNNFTRKVSTADPFFIAGCKGLVSGVTNITIALCLQFQFPHWLTTIHALIIGFIGYGASLVLFVFALRGLGTARTGAYFSTAPFVGAAIAILIFHEPTSVFFWFAIVLMGIGVGLHLTEHHEHEHLHEPVVHHHSHTHDEHHRHHHDFEWDGKEPHSHSHRHETMKHSHPHFPDIHHRHHHN